MELCSPLSSPFSDSPNSSGEKNNSIAKNAAASRLSQLEKWKAKEAAWRGAASQLGREEKRASCVSAHPLFHFYF